MYTSTVGPKSLQNNRERKKKVSNVHTFLRSGIPPRCQVVVHFHTSCLKSCSLPDQGFTRCFFFFVNLEQVFSTTSVLLCNGALCCHPKNLVAQVHQCTLSHGIIMTPVKQHISRLLSQPDLFSLGVLNAGRLARSLQSCTT